ncbi:hypothetical protein [Microvirga terricola]|uniref:Uncharacterized protein n=1 Tax=Microvirga terricola TaxID=2719797 RepID=A0ABX0V657_9HYPH|nr:hypothetical protein [Microvirga terricola]NIX75202.1 hypothetical protein [Microvirga terricola]
MIVGSGSRAVVFYDATDLFWTAGIFIFPVATLIIGGGAAQFVPKGHSDSLLQTVKDFPLVFAIIGIPIVGFFISVIVTIVSSIRHNGLIIGLIMIVLKLSASFFLLLAALGALYATEGDIQRGKRFLAIVLFGLLGWITIRMINGHRVEERRLMLQEAAVEA